MYIAIERLYGLIRGQSGCKQCCRARGLGSNVENLSKESLILTISTGKFGQKTS